MKQRAFSTLRQKSLPATIRVMPVLLLFTLTAVGTGSVTNAGQEGKPSHNQPSRSSQTEQQDTSKTTTGETQTLPTLGESSATPAETLENSARPFTATAYCLSGRTASGSYPQRGSIAADTRVLPLGTIVKLHAGQYSGVYKVVDTGSKIRGHRIDVYMPSKSEARKFGRRNINLEVLQKAHHSKKVTGHR